MEPVWAATRKALADYVSEVNYKIWIDPLKPLGFEGGILRLGCPNQFFSGLGKRTLSRKYHENGSDGQRRGISY